jgi:dTDP-4-dehydrorhamnose 3,5-epimerase
MIIESHPIINDVKIIRQFRHDDHRGAFVKTFHDPIFQEQGINFDTKESFYSTSHQHVWRGFHFHHAPYAHAKIIFCTAGQILDMALDIRPDSNTFGKVANAELSFDNNTALYIPEGFAHGFLTLSTMATTFYFVSGAYQPSADDGILYSSVPNLNLPENIITNERDQQFQTLESYLKKNP